MKERVNFCKMYYVWIAHGFNIEVGKINSDVKEYDLKLKKTHFASRIMQKLVPYLGSKFVRSKD
jgi:hypothetical protein